MKMAASTTTDIKHMVMPKYGHTKDGYTRQMLYPGDSRTIWKSWHI